jgi:hypothetical protein
VGPTEVTRRVSASGLIGVCYQQVSAGRHLAGQVVTVRLHPTVLQVFFAGQLIRTVPRTNTKEVVLLRAHRPHQPKRPKTNYEDGNHHPEPNPKASTGTGHPFVVVMELTVDTPGLQPARRPYERTAAAAETKRRLAIRRAM